MMFSNLATTWNYGKQIALPRDNNLNDFWTLKKKCKLALIVR